MLRKEKIEKIAELFARFRTEVESLNSLNLYDINVHAENVIIPILNLVYGVNLVNINNRVRNSAAIDLVDTENRIAVQVTSTSTGDKVKHTINEFVKGKRCEDYDRLLIYIITEKLKKYSDAIFSVACDNELEFSEKDILDYSDILKEVNSLISIAKIDSLLQLLKDEFCEEEISKRRYLLEHREIIKTEVLFPNILEVNIPSKVYVGIIGIDRDDIITQSWSTPNKLKKSASMGKVLSKAFELLKITYCRDWFTFEDKILKLIGRRHSSNDVKNAVKLAQNTDFENISLDFIYGLPQQTIDGFENDLKTAISLNIQHISLYGLKIDENCYFYKNPPQNLPDEDTQADMYIKAIETMTNNDFLHYEISNFAKDNFQSRHNLNYWDNNTYYGFGVSAHGYENGARYFNPTTLGEYINNPTIHKSSHKLSKQEQLEEEIFLGFRKMSGINVENINKKFNIDFRKKYTTTIDKYLSYKYLKETNVGFALTDSGILISNVILAEFLN